MNVTHRPDVWRRVRRILAVRVDNMGDILMTTPALAAMAESVPGIEITLFGAPSATALAPHLPMVSSVITARVPWVRHEDEVSLDDDAELIECLRTRRFDAAVIFTVCTQSALPAAMLCRLAGIPLRLAHARENPYALLSDWAPETDLDLANARHEVQRQLDLVAQVGWHTNDERLRFTLNAQDTTRMEQRLQRAALIRGPLVLVHVGASAPSRRWPAQRFGAVADALALEHKANIIFTGSTNENVLIETARAAMQHASLSLAGQLSLGELAALIARADVLISNNSGPAHLAAALGTPVVDLYALTNPQHTPWRVPARVLNHDVPCRNCLKSRCPEPHHLCLRGVTVQHTTTAALELLATKPTLQSPMLEHVS